MEPEQPLNQQPWAPEMKEIRALLLREISKESPLITEKAEIDTDLLSLVLSLIAGLDDVLDNKSMSWALYRLTWLALFGLLAELDLKPFLTQKIKDTYGRDCFLLKHILKDTHNGAV